MSKLNHLIQGLSDEEVILSRQKNGFNSLDHQNKNYFLASLIEMIKEPMFLLLVLATSLYFITAKYADGIFMTLAIVLISAISLYQESRSRNAIALLKKLSQPKSKVIRNGEILEMPSEESGEDEV